MRRPHEHAAPSDADADTNPSERSVAATPRMPPPPATSTWPWCGDGPQTSTGIETRQERTRPPMNGPGQSATERPSSTACDHANATAAVNEPNDATPTRPEAARDDTRQETKPHEPARKAAYTTDEKDGVNEDMANRPSEATRLRHTRHSRPAAAAERAAARPR